MPSFGSEVPRMSFDGAGSQAAVGCVYPPMGRARSFLFTLAATLAAAAAIAPAASATHPPINNPGIPSFPDGRPTVTGVTTTSATFSVRVTTYPNHGAAEVWFDYCVVQTCNTQPFSEAPQPHAILPGSSTEQTRTVTVTVTDLRPGTDYFVVGHARGGTPAGGPGTTLSSQETFSTPEAPPDPFAATGPATEISGTAATLTGTVQPGGVGTTYRFQYGTTSALGSETPQVSAGAGTDVVDVSARLTGLTEGRTYFYRLAARRSDGRELFGQIGSLTTLSATCPAAGFDRRTVKVGRLSASGCFKQAGEHYLANGPLTLNGLSLNPAASTNSKTKAFGACSDSACQALQSAFNASGGGGYLVIDVPGRRIVTNRRYSMDAGTLRVFNGVLDEAVDPSATGPVLDLDSSGGGNVKGFPVTGRFTVAAKDDGASLGLTLGLPNLLGGVTGGASLGVSPSGALQVDGVRVSVGETGIKTLRLTGLSFEYDRGEDLWKGTAGLILPTPQAYQLNVGVEVRNNRLSSLEGSVDNINQPIAKAIFLQKIGLNFGFDPLRFGGTVGISGGPKVLGTSALGAEGSLLITFPQRGTISVPNFPTYEQDLAFGIRAEGTLKIVEAPVATSYFQYYAESFPFVLFGGTVTYGLGGIASINGKVDGFLYNNAFNAEGSVAAAFLGIDVASAKALISTKGLAVCGTAAGISYGAGKLWGARADSFSSCNFGPYVDRNFSGRAMAAADAVSFGFPRDAAFSVLKFIGRDRAPLVTLTGPGGRRITTPTGEPPRTVVPKQSLVIRDEPRKTTIVEIVKPGAGTWRADLAPGSTPLADIRQSNSLPAPSVKAKLRRERGGHYELSWRARSIPGQRLTFLEQAPGVARSIVGPIARSTGRRTFRPASGPGGVRNIVVQVEQAGFTRKNTVVARFVAPKPRLPGKPAGVRLRRKGTRVIATWRPTGGHPASFDVLARISDGRRVLLRGKRPTVTIRGIAADESVRVTIRGASPTGRLGAPAVRRLPVKPAA